MRYYYFNNVLGGELLEEVTFGRGLCEVRGKAILESVVSELGQRNLVRTGV